MPGSSSADWKKVRPLDGNSPCLPGSTTPGTGNGSRLMFTLVGAPAWVVNVMVVETKERPSIRRTKSETAKDAEVNFPFASVLTLVVCPVVLLVMNTLAPLIGPPFVDETVPVIVAVPASWAPAADR